MATTTPTPVRTAPSRLAHAAASPQPDPTPSSAPAEELPAYFRRLLAQRELFGRLAEAQRSHHGQDANADALDSVVTLLTEELEANFPQLWEPLEGELLVTELGLLHDPAEGPMPGCGICHEQTLTRRREKRRAKQTSRHRGHAAAARTPVVAAGLEAA